MRSSVRLAGVLAGALMFSLASSARAEFSLQIMNNDTGDGFKISENASHTAFAVTTFGAVKPSDVTWSASSGVIDAKVTIDNYAFNVETKSNRTAASDLGVVSLNAYVTTNAGAKQTTFSYYTGDNYFTAPGAKGSPVILAASVNSLNTWNAGDRVSNAANLVSSNFPNPSTSYMTAQTNSVSGGNQEQRSSMTIPVGGTQYTLGNLGGLYQASGQSVGSQIHFWSQAVTAMPEPTGVLIALFGVPCLGLVLLVVRRRGLRFSAAA